ncbi:hypothetical protein BDV95DRAFT_494539 [Massariosphaeria phaeospora]|uniref:CCHC-type domain-containing protein n=1 Tax=Massariosphaeria phaeospora TaxID=100035 RepID=A0A7C8M992_9PLEO|nr:hypothetical protein BDV95DRAFT_494539 [Massariosphaeria phaeospora]
MDANTPKSMSSRLLTMKFMQRSASKSGSSGPSTPNGPPSKKMRLSNGTPASATPGSPSNRATFQATPSEEEKKRLDALDRAAEKAGETHWVLSFKETPNASKPPTMQVRHVGFAVIDAEAESEDEENAKPVTMQYGGGLKKKQVCYQYRSGCIIYDLSQKPVNEVIEDSEGNSSSEYDSDDPTAELIRETKREIAVKEREGGKARKDTVRQQPKRQSLPMDDVDLHGLTSLSGPRGMDSGRPAVECYKCGRKGHGQSACPNGFAPRGSAGRGQGRGRR